MYHRCYFLQGGNRRTHGRRGGSGARGTKPRTGGDPVKFEGEFDFESSNAKFNKEEIEEELQQKLHENLRITDEVNNCLCFICISRKNPLSGNTNEANGSQEMVITRYQLQIYCA